MTTETDVPRAVVTALDTSSDDQLREIIHYAQRQLRDRPTLTDAVEAREREQLVRVEDDGACSVVVVERPEETGRARGPFAYRVRWEPSLDGETGQYRWHYLGRAYGSDE